MKNEHLKDLEHESPSVRVRVERELQTIILRYDSGIVKLGTLPVDASDLYESKTLDLNP